MKQVSIFEIERIVVCGENQIKYEPHYSKWYKIRNEEIKKVVFNAEDELIKKHIEYFRKVIELQERQGYIMVSSENSLRIDGIRYCLDEDWIKNFE